MEDKMTSRSQKILNLLKPTDSELKNKSNDNFIFRNYETAEFKSDITHSDISRCKTLLEDQNVLPPQENKASNKVRRTLFLNNESDQINERNANINGCMIDPADPVLNCEQYYTDTTVFQTNINKDKQTLTESNKTTSEFEYTPKTISTKRNFCLFCKKLVSKIPRHYACVHGEEESVKEFLELPKGCFQRKLLIEKLRKAGNFTHNTDENYNTGHLVTCRKTQKISEDDFKKFKPCPVCKGFYSARTLRKHKCLMGPKPENLFVESKRIHGVIHRKACAILKNNVFPVLREDAVTNAIRYDELVILYANNMCCKYRSTHHYSMIRSRMRLIGRFLIAIKTVNPAIANLASVFVPENYDDVVKSINIVAGLNETSSSYSAPHTALSLGTALKYITNILITEYIKKGDREKKNKAKDFLKLMEQGLSSSINKTVIENVLQQKRHRNIVLPTSSDLRKLNNYLSSNRRKYYKNLIEEKFSYENWIKLSSFTLISLQVFNRRRAGELERALISDFNSRQNVDKTTDPHVFNSLSKVAQAATQQYERFVIRGKLARGVAVLMHKELIDNIDAILKFRETAGVSSDNPYIFGIPSRNVKYNYLRATKLLREYSVECGAANPSTLRGTQLRKHIASQSVLLNLKDNEINDLATFLGHSTKIHKDYYQIPIITRDIAQMSQLLEKAQGAASDSDSQDGNIELVSNHRLMADHESTTNLNYYNSEKFSCNQGINVTSDFPVNSRNLNHSQIKSNSTDKNDSIASVNQKKLEEYSCNRKINLTTESPVNSTDSENTQLKSNRIGRHSKYTTTAPKMDTNKTDNSFSEDDDNSIADPDFIYEQYVSESEVEEYPNSDSDIEVNQKERYHKTSIYKTPKKSRSNFNKGYIQRSTWNTPEKRVVRLVFSEYIKCGNLPSFSKCAEIIHEHKELKNRTAMQVKLWVHNQITKNKIENLKDTSCLNTRKRRTVKCWTTPEKHAIREGFANNLINNTLPSYAECHKLKEKYSILNKRTVQVIKAYVCNELRRKQTKKNVFSPIGS